MFKLVTGALALGATTLVLLFASDASAKVSECDSLCGAWTPELQEKVEIAAIERDFEELTKLTLKYPECAATISVVGSKANPDYAPEIAGAVVKGNPSATNGIISCIIQVFGNDVAAQVFANLPATAAIPSSGGPVVLPVGQPVTEDPHASSPI